MSLTKFRPMPSLSEERIKSHNNKYLGERFGRLIITDIFSDGIKCKAKCECDCGKTAITNLYSIKSGATKSCGCLQKEKMHKLLYGKPKESVSKYFTLSIINRLYGAYRFNSKNKNRIFDISLDDFKKIIHSPCEYCGGINIDKHTLKNLVHSNKIFMCNGMDRIDSSKGYTKSNVVSCCHMCNMMKRHHSPKDFILACNKISEYNRGKYE